jgi:hypothetical protein
MDRSLDYCRKQLDLGSRWRVAPWLPATIM